jgi:spermidine synthase
VLRVAKACTAVNHDVLHNPKVHIAIGDAREVLLTSRDRYDIIFSEPSNPYRAGIASLFTREFYEAASARLNRGGMMLQWVQTYDVDAETIGTIYATMGAVFPQVATWRTSEGDLLLVATRVPIAFDLAQLRRRVASEPYRTALHATWRVESAEGFLAHFVASDRVARVAGRGARINSDDRTPIEFGFARSVGDVSRFSMSEVFGLASALGEPPAAGDVLVQRGSDPSVDVPIGVMSADERAHHDFATTWSNGNFRASMSSWTEHGRWQPVNSAEIAMLAETSIDTGEGDPNLLLDVLRKWEPIEADVLEARFLLRKGNANAGTELLRRAFVAYRANPWPQTAIMSRALDLAVTLGTLDRANATVLYDALASQFAAGQLNQSRLETRLTLARRLDDCGPRTIASLRAFEPWVPWDRPTLENRARCYSGSLAERARAELAEFIANEPRPLAQ